MSGIGMSVLSNLVFAQQLLPLKVMPEPRASVY